MTMISPARSTLAYERFICEGTAKDGRRCLRPLVEVDWERKVIRKKCDQCGQWHVLSSTLKLIQSR